MDVTFANVALTILSLIADNLGIKSLFQLAPSASSERTPLCTNPQAFYIRRERRDRQRVVNVFDKNGAKRYTIERKTQFSPIWSLLEYPTRKELSTIRAGLVDQSVDFHNKTGLQHRQFTTGLRATGPYRKFYLNDGAEYEWSRPSRYLERVVNPGGGDEERRERVAKARLMRQYRFDYEMLVDPAKVDPEVALATGFIAMNTQWGLNSTSGTRGPTQVTNSLVPAPVIEPINKQLVEENDEQLEVENRVFLVMERPDGQKSDPVELGTGNRQAYAPGISAPTKRLQIENGRFSEMKNFVESQIEA